MHEHLLRHLAEQFIPPLGGLRALTIMSDAGVSPDEKKEEAPPRDCAHVFSSPCPFVDVPHAHSVSEVGITDEDAARELDADRPLETEDPEEEDVDGMAPSVCVSVFPLRISMCLQQRCKSTTSTYFNTNSPKRFVQGFPAMSTS